MLRRTCPSRISLVKPFLPLNDGVAPKKIIDEPKTRLQGRVVQVLQMGPALGKYGMYSYEMVKVVEKDGRVRSLRNKSTASVKVGDCVELAVAKTNIHAMKPWDPRVPPPQKSVRSYLSTMTGTVTSAETTELEWGKPSDSLRSYPNASQRRVYAHWYTFIPHGSTTPKTLYHPSDTKKPLLEEGFETTITFPLEEREEETLSICGFKIVSTGATACSA